MCTSSSSAHLHILTKTDNRNTRRKQQQTLDWDLGIVGCGASLMGFGANQDFDFTITSAEHAATLYVSQNGKGVFKSISEISGNYPLTPSQNHSLICVIDSVMKSFQKEIRMLPGTALSTAAGPNDGYLTRASYTWRLLSSVCNGQKADKHTSLS